MSLCFGIHIYNMFKFFIALLAVWPLFCQVVFADDDGVVDDVDYWEVRLIDIFFK